MDMIADIISKKPNKRILEKFKNIDFGPKNDPLSPFSIYKFLMYVIRYITKILWINLEKSSKVGPKMPPFTPFWL